ncbi:uncharacterized protein LOC108631857 [Ceratina calcarata]|uniref:Uncharacterized protein LOC108631857 n=1 Tax=Ceratina calcarata TaxID=156304 RepID=A0AAJ7JEC7_9HYME|nr:uncharacterized protein LOC108631857 [Ceratina calcarata]
MNKLLILGLLATSAMAIPAPGPDNKSLNTELDCLEEDNALFSCIFVKTIGTLNRAARSSDIEIIDGVKFIRETPMERSGKDLKTEVEVMNELPRDTTERAMKLIGMLYESAMSFVKSHSLKLSVPEEGSISRALDEGRGKLKKVALPLIIAAAVKLFALVPIVIGSLGLLVAKALFVGKIALLVAGVLAFQRLFGNGSSGAASFFSKNSSPSTGWVDSGSQGWPANAGIGGPSQGYYKRSFDAENGKIDAHSMAYSAQAPITNEAH